MTPPSAFFLDIDWSKVSAAYSRAGLFREGSQGSSESTLFAGRGLAHAIAASPGWREFPEGVVVFRDGPPPTMGILFGDEVPDFRTLEARAAQLPLSLDLLKFRSWEEVVKDASVLADVLRVGLGEDELRRARWIAIPRGGRIVLGLLSYLLDLPPSTPSVDDAPIIIVDDCILSGRRLRGKLSEVGSDLDVKTDPESDPRIYVATLFSHSAVRETLVARESALEGILSARDLEDHADEVYGDEVESWKERWSRRSDTEDVWIGLPDHICFPWNEPDTGLWNGSREIRAWRVLPPEVCLKNRPSCGETLGTRVMVDEGGYLFPCPDVLVGSVGGSLVVASRVTGRSLKLSGSAREMWEVSSRAGDRRTAVDELASRFGADRAVVGEDLKGFEERLIDWGFLERRE